MSDMVFDQRTHNGTVDDRQHGDRRGLNIITNVIIPIIVAVIIGSGASYIATQVTLSVVETKVKYIEKDIGKITELMTAITSQNLIITKNKTTIDGALYRLNILEDSIITMKGDTKLRYTSEHAERDQRYIERRLNELQSQITQLQEQLKGK